MRSAVIGILVLWGSESKVIGQQQPGQHGPGVLIQVVDAKTGEDLSDITILQIKDPPWGVCHPGVGGGVQPFTDFRTLATHVASPCRVFKGDGNGMFEWQDSLFVGAPDHAWERIKVNFMQGGERYVVLEEGAVLEINVSGPAAGELQNPTGISGTPSTLAELMQETEEPIAGDSTHLVLCVTTNEPPLELLFLGRVRVGGLVRIAGLPVGDCTVSQLTGQASRVIGADWVGAVPSELVASRVNATLVAGRTDGVVVEPVSSPRPRQKSAPLSGTIDVPEGFDPSSLELTVRPLALLAGSSESLGFDQWQPDRIVSRRYLWNAGKVIPGAYLLAVEGANFSEDILIGPQGDTAVALLLPPPAYGFLRLVEESTGGSVAVKRVSWMPMGSGFFDGGRRNEEAEPAADLPVGTYRIATHAGPGQPVIWDDKWCLIDDHVVTLTPGANDVTFVVRRTCGLVLKLMDGVTEIPWKDVIQGTPTFTRIAGSGEMKSTMCGANGEQRFLLGSPGRWRISLPKTRFYLPVPAFVVEVSPGELLEYPINLARRR